MPEPSTSGRPPAQGCCPPLAVQALAPSTAGLLAPMFKALSDPIRLRLLSLIASMGEACVCELTAAFDVTGATISHHLRVLREADLVESERRGTWIYYRMRQETADLLGSLLANPAQQPAGQAAALPHPAAHQETDTGPKTTAQLTAPSAAPDVLRLLADPLRAEIIRILADGPTRTSELVATTGAKQPNISGHLKQLRDAGVVAPEPHGRFTYYRLVPEALQTAGHHLADLAARAHTNSGGSRTGR
jgi:ArsR family transcriptional regulator